MPKDGGIGDSSKRREDLRFLTGKGRYTDDINMHGQAYAHFVRSDVAHGTINSVDASAAEAYPGGQGLHGQGFRGWGGIPWLAGDRPLRRSMQEPKHPILAEGKVRHVGDPIAVSWLTVWSRPATRPRRSTSTSPNLSRFST